MNSGFVSTVCALRDPNRYSQTKAKRIRMGFYYMGIQKVIKYKMIMKIKIKSKINK